MAVVLKRKKLTINEKMKIIQVEKNPTVSQNEIVKRFVLPPASLSNIILQKTSVLEEESWCGEHSERERKKN
jgi:hypothetical protein